MFRAATGEAPTRLVPAHARATFRHISERWAQLHQRTAGSRPLKPYWISHKSLNEAILCQSHYTHFYNISLSFLLFPSSAFKISVLISLREYQSTKSACAGLSRPLDLLRIQWPFENQVRRWWSDLNKLWYHQCYWRPLVENIGIDQFHKRV